jgi:hypothetical protein
MSRRERNLILLVLAIPVPLGPARSPWNGETTETRDDGDRLSSARRDVSPQDEKR